MNNKNLYLKSSFRISTFLIFLLLFLSQFSLAEENHQYFLPEYSTPQTELFNNNLDPLASNYSIQKAFSNPATNPALLFLLNTEILQIDISNKNITKQLQLSVQASNNLPLSYFFIFFKKNKTSKEVDLVSIV